MPVRKARPRLTDLLGRMPNKRQAGGRFLLVTSLLDKQKRSNSGAAGARKLFAVDSDAATSMELKVLAPSPTLG